MATELLTDKAIANSKPREKKYTLKGGYGLFVLVHPNGSKYFQMRSTLHGKDKLTRLGIYGVNMTLKQAREKSAEVRTR